MPNHRYEDLWFPLPPFDFKQVKTTEIRKVARLFRRRIGRVHNMIEFPSHLIGLSGKYTEATFRLAAAMAIHGGNVVPENWGEAQRGMVNQMHHKEIQNPHLWDECRALNFDAFLKLLGRYGLVIEVQSIFIGMILSGWAAIEVTIKDLYWAARKSSSTAEAAASRGMPPSAKRINELQLKRRHITQHSASKPNPQIGFASLQRSREAYSMAFDVDTRRIDMAMSDLNLDSLALIRNLFVHNDLVPDKDFRDRGRNIPGLKRFVSPTCKMVKINGRVTRLLVHKAVQATEELISAVDQWIQKHP